jgi:hypothetical protein
LRDGEGNEDKTTPKGRPVEETTGKAADTPAPAPKGWEQAEIPWPLPSDEGEAPPQEVGGVF